MGIGSMTEGFWGNGPQTLSRHDAARQRIRLTFELLRQRFHRCREHAYALMRDVDATLADDLVVAIAERMRNDDDRQADVTDAFAYDLRESGKGGTDDGDRRDAQIF
jgi:hypothetical protein